MGAIVKPRLQTHRKPARIGSDATITSYKDLTPLFGISGVMFGNSMPNSEKDSSAMLCAAAYLDISRVLGIDPTVIGLGNRLGMAFGSHGKGGKNAPAAHYQGGKIQAIALTRKAGAGSLAHEWMHAVDHFLSDDDDLMSRGTHSPEMAALAEAINASELPECSKEADKAKTKPYFRTPSKMIARVFAHHVQTELEALGQINDYLLSIDPEAIVYPTVSEAEVFASLIRSLADGTPVSKAGHRLPSSRIASGNPTSLTAVTLMILSS